MINTIFHNNYNNTIPSPGDRRQRRSEPDHQTVPVHWLAGTGGPQVRRGLHRLHRAGSQDQGAVRTGGADIRALQVSEWAGWLAGWVASQLTIKTLHRVASNLAVQPRCALHSIPLHCTGLDKTYSLSNLSRDIIARHGMRKSSERFETSSSFYLFTYLWSAVGFILSKFYFIFWNSC